MDKKIRLHFVTLCISIAGIVVCQSKANADASTPSPPEATASQTAIPGRLHQKYSLLWVDNNIPPIMRSGTPVTVQVRVKNTGDWTWPDAKTANPAKPDGSYAVRLTYRWVNANKIALPENQGRGEITAAIPAGGTALFSIEIIPPKESGSYQLQLDLVQELVTFFSAKGVEKLVVPVTVQ